MTLSWCLNIGSDCSVEETSAYLKSRQFNASFWKFNKHTRYAKAFGVQPPQSIVSASMDPCLPERVVKEKNAELCDLNRVIPICKNPLSPTQENSLSRNMFRFKLFADVISGQDCGSLV